MQARSQAKQKLSELGRAPVVWFLLEMPDPGDQRVMAFLSGPLDGFALGSERGQDVVGMVFDHIIIDRAVVGTTLGTGFDVDVHHQLALISTRFSSTLPGTNVRSQT
jgi:hypothetical protein